MCLNVGLPTAGARNSYVITVRDDLKSIFEAKGDVVEGIELSACKLVRTGHETGRGGE